MESSSQDLAGALLMIFKTNSSVTGSKFNKGFPAKEVTGQAVGFGGRKFRWKSITKTDDHFDLPPLIRPSSSRSPWLNFWARF